VSPGGLQAEPDCVSSHVHTVEEDRILGRGLKDEPVVTEPVKDSRWRPLAFVDVRSCTHETISQVVWFSI